MLDVHGVSRHTHAGERSIVRPDSRPREGRGSSVLGTRTPQTEINFQNQKSKLKVSTSEYSTEKSKPLKKTTQFIRKKDS